MKSPSVLLPGINHMNGLNHNALTCSAVPIPPWERSLQTVEAQPYFSVSQASLVLEGIVFDRNNNLLFVDVATGRVFKLTPERQLSIIFLSSFSRVRSAGEGSGSSLQAGDKILRAGQHRIDRPFCLAAVGTNQFDRQFPESPSELGCAGTSAFRSADPEHRMLVAVKCDRFTMFINVLPGSHHVVKRVF